MTIDDVRGKTQPQSLRGVWIVPLSLLAMLIQGYHPGAEDDGVYLAAIHWRLHPTLFPFDAEFFRVQLQASGFDALIAGIVRVLHLPVNVVMLACQFGAICLLLYACLRLSRHLFAGAQAQLSAITLVALLFALPVAGTALFLVDRSCIHALWQPRLSCLPPMPYCCAAHTGAFLCCSSPCCCTLSWRRSG